MFDTFDRSNSYVKDVIQSITLNVEYKDVIYMAFEPTFDTQQPDTI
ncbi:MAG: hypothetical protein MJ219_02100 [Mycoplasmoidaceae bacterium]|nr:hypothetical protein [Mycoplasmoidaceae bacterium]